MSQIPRRAWSYYWRNLVLFGMGVLLLCFVSFGLWLARRPTSGLPTGAT
ncbi:MAG: hypothetical protein KKC18_12850 [Chloroflexi bacterium]|nr:hypothetical protein [Chloroflexota bacterium]